MPSSFSILNWIKPSRSEATTRLRTNGLALVVLFLVTNLAPVPSLWTAFQVVSSRSDVGLVWWALCIAETLLLGIIGTNILQCSYALQYPPTANAPLTSASTKVIPQSPAPKIPRKLGVTPLTTPQPQKSFNSSYLSSPVSTPSRTLNYTIPPSGSPFDSSFASSTSSFPGSPNPILNSPLAAYRGKHNSGTGRAFNGELLTRLRRYDEDD